MATFQELKDKEQAQKTFQELKLDGSRLLKEGQIDPETYYAKTRQAGIELGLISPNEYPDRLPKWVKPTLEVFGGTLGLIGGSLAGGIPGGAIGAGAGVATAALAADWLGDLRSPDMPAPGKTQRLREAALKGTVDTALTAALPFVGKALSPAIRGAVQGTKDAGTKAIGMLTKDVPSTSETVSLFGRALGITDEAAKKANLLKQEGIDLSLGQASSSPFVQGAYTLSSRMPIAGGPGQKQLRESFAQVAKALNRRISPEARVRPMTESQRSKLIEDVGLKSFKEAKRTYTSVYDKADEISKAKGVYFDMNPIVNTAIRARPRSKFTEATKDIKVLLDDLAQYKDTRVAFDDVGALDKRLKDLARKYDPAKTDKPNYYAYKTAVNLTESLKRQIRNPKDEAGKLYVAGDKLFRKYMKDVENKTGAEFTKAFGRGAIRPGIGRPPTQRVETLYAKTFGTAKSPEAIKELKALVGKQDFNRITANYLDDTFTKYMRADKKDFDGLFKEFGFDNPKSLNYEATEELLKDYVHTNVKDLSALLSALKQFPEVIPDVNTFIQRSGILRAAQGVGPGAFAGMVGANISGGPVGAVAGLGIMYALNKFLAQAFNKNLIKNAVKTNPTGVKKFLTEFLNSLPKLPQSVSPAAVAVQPIVPLAEDQLTQLTQLTQ